MVLENFKLELSLGNLVENGYDEFKFMLTMNESEVIEMLEDANIEKKGLMKNFVATLNIHKCQEVNQVALRKINAALPGADGE